MKSPHNPLSLVTPEPDIVRKSRGEAREKSGHKVQGVEGSRAGQARLIAHMLHNAQAQSYRTPRPAEPRTFVFSRKISRVFLIGPHLILAYIKLYPTHYGSSCWATQPSPALPPPTFAIFLRGDLMANYFAATHTLIYIANCFICSFPVTAGTQARWSRFPFAIQRVETTEVSILLC